ncbi:MAG: hypothetical protein NC407_12470 [Lachnoclostridium sp.]|nr:hypothetical protein [Lachnoclostridium sp.]
MIRAGWFLLTTGWHGIRFADLNTLWVAGFAIMAAAAACAASGQKEVAEEEKG